MKIHAFIPLAAFDAPAIAKHFVRHGNSRPIRCEKGNSSNINVHTGTVSTRISRAMLTQYTSGNPGKAGFHLA